MKYLFHAILLSAVSAPIYLFGSGMGITFRASDGRLTSADRKLKHSTWLKDKAETALAGGVSGKINEWNQISFEFIPEKNGMVTVFLKGPFEKNKPLDQWQWVVFDNVRVNGKLLPNGGFEDGLENWQTSTWGELRMTPQIVEDPMMVKSGKRAVRLWHNGIVKTKFPVKAGEKVLVQLHYMPTNHYNVNEKDFPLSLEKQANRAFADEKAGDGKGGWSDQGPENDLRLFDTSRKQIGNVSFAFPKGEKQIVVFDSPHDKTGLKSISLDIPENAKGKYLYLLHSSCWTPKSGIIGELVFTGADGKSKNVPVRIGEDIRDWSNPQDLPNGLAVWKIQSGNAKKSLYLSKFKVPVRELKSVEITGSGNAVWILCGATLSLQDLNISVSWTPGKEYRPADMAEKNITLPGSILDFSVSSLKKIDRVVIGKNGKFEIADNPGKTVRFHHVYHYPLGLHLLHLRKMNREALHRKIDEYLDEASRRGYNIIRTIAIDRTVFHFGKNNMPDPAGLDAMDYFIYSAKKRNIYINFSLAGSLMCTNWNWERLTKESIKDRKTKILIGDPRIRQMWIDLAKLFLCRVNPYTKTMLKDEPMLVMVEPLNELAFGLLQTPNKETMKLVHEKFRDFLEKKLGGKVPYLPEDPIRNQGKYRKEWIEFHYLCIRDTMQFFRNELDKLGIKTPVAQYNLAAHRQYGDVRSEFDDVVIKNIYFAHPVPISRNFTGSRCPQDSAIGTAGAYFRNSISVRLADRPMVVTEYNHAFWNKYEYEQILFPAYAAFQDYAGLSMHQIDLLEENVIRDVFYSSLMDRSHEMLSYLLFLRGDITPSKHLTQLSIPKSSLLAEDAFDTISQEQTRGALLTRFALKYEDTPRPAMIAALPEPKPDVVIPLAGSSKMKQSALFVEAQDDKSGSFDFGKLVSELKAKKILSPSNRTDAANGIYESDTDELLLNAPQKYMMVKTAKTEVIASEEPTAETLPCMQKVSSSIPATVAISAMDGKTLAESGKMLLFYLTETANTGMELSGDRITMKKIGKSPVLLRTGKLDLKLKLAPGKQYTLYPLRSDGLRREGISLATRDGITEIHLDTAKLPHGAAFYFELVREK